MKNKHTKNLHIYVPCIFSLGRNDIEAYTRDAGKLEAFTYPVKLKGAFTIYFSDEESLSIVAYYVLTNMPEVSPYIT